MLGTDPKAGSRVLVEEAGVVAVGADVSGTADVDPQAITASMIARQDAMEHQVLLEYDKSQSEVYLSPDIFLSSVTLWD